MKIVRINQLLETEREVKGEGFTSIRALLEKDNMGFSLHKTIIPKGGPYHWHYKHHLEACYCIKGKGEIIDLATGLKILITPDVVYVLDNHDNHTFEALEDTILISIFNPPIKGTETHKKDGSYSI
jgi:L-ectoine synthase